MNASIKNVNDTMLLEQFSELVVEIRQIAEVANHQYAARTMCNISGGGGN